MSVADTPQFRGGIRIFSVNNWYQSVSFIGTFHVIRIGMQFAKKIAILHNNNGQPAAKIRCYPQTGTESRSRQNRSFTSHGASD